MSMKVALVVRLVAKSGKEDELAGFLAGALPLAQAETSTPVWYAVRAGRDVFYIFDAFADDAARQRHVKGEIATALFARAPELLAEPPRIEAVDVLAAKLPGLG
jgi:quinol monooxygenase YgiN